MTTPSITLDQTLPAIPVNETVQQGSLEGRSVVPCPSKRWLTDTQIKKIALVALAIIAFAIPVIILGALTFGLGEIIVGAALTPIFVPLGLMLGSFPFILWPKADFQTPEGAKIIRKDIKTKTLTELHRNYNFSDLAKYGYISKESCDKLKELYNSRPEHLRTYNARGGIDRKASDELNAYHGIYDKEKQIEAEFDAMRSQPGFIL